MAHYARVQNNLVIQVIVAEQDYIDSYNGDLCGEWIQTSYNTRGGVHYDPQTGKPSVDQTKALRKNFAGLGYTYNRELDAFIPPSPYNSWVLNEDTGLWEPPTPIPDMTKHYTWDELSTSWIEIIFE